MIWGFRHFRKPAIYLFGQFHAISIRLHIFWDGITPYNHQPTLAALDMFYGEYPKPDASSLFSHVLPWHVNHQNNYPYVIICLYIYLHIYIYTYIYIHIYIYIYCWLCIPWLVSQYIHWFHRHVLSAGEASALLQGIIECHHGGLLGFSGRVPQGTLEDQLGQPKMGNLGDSAGSTNNTSWPVTNPRIHYRMIECAFFGRLEVCCKRLFKSPSTYMSINYSMWEVLKTALGWLFHAST